VESLSYALSCGVRDQEPFAGELGWLVRRLPNRWSARAWLNHAASLVGGNGMETADGPARAEDCLGIFAKSSSLGWLGQNCMRRRSASLPLFTVAIWLGRAEFLVNPRSCGLFVDLWRGLRSRQDAGLLL